jgi:hypothetical protein
MDTVVVVSRQEVFRTFCPPETFSDYFECRAGVGCENAVVRFTGVEKLQYPPTGFFGQLGR